MGKALSVASATLPWALTLLGVTLPAVTGGLSTASAVVNALPKDRKKLKKFVQMAADDFANQCAHESRNLPVADRDAVEERLMELLEMGDRPRLLGMALIGEPEFRAALLAAESYRGLGADEQGFLNALAIRVHGLVLRLAQSPEVVGVASTNALRVILAEVMARPTVDQVQRMIQQAVVGELQVRQLIVGGRPRLAGGFVARDELIVLREVLSGAGVATVCALQGMRGVGKSQLASALAEECEIAGWRFVGWVNAPTRAQAMTELAEISRLAGVSTAGEDPDTAARAAVAWLSSAGPHDRLLVFDNVTNAEHLTDLVPHGPGMRVLVTIAGRTNVLGTAVEVGVYSVEQAIRYLEAATGRVDREGARGVAEDLGWLPVALAQATVAMNLWCYDFGRYRQLLAERALDDVVRQEDGDPYPTKVGAALRMAFAGVLEHLAETVPSVCEAARAVLSALSVMAESGVPREWLYKVGDDEHAAREAVGELLARFLLVESDDGSVLSLHRLQSQVIREATLAGAGFDPLPAVKQILSAIDLSGQGDYSRRRLLCMLLGLQLGTIHGQEHSHELLEDPALLAIAASTVYESNRLGDPYTSISLAAYVADHERVLGAEHRDTLGFRNNVAYAYESAGYLGRAISLFEQTLADSERVLGTEHPNTLDCRNNLASAYAAAGDLSRAIPLHEQTLADRERVLGSHHSETLVSRNNLADAYRSAGDLGRAIPLFEQILADRERILGSEDPDILTSRNNLAGAYLSAGDQGRAIPIYERTLAESERILGADHPNTLASRNNLAGALRSAGDYGRAITLYEQTVADRVRVLGADHPNTLVSRNNLGFAYGSAGHLGRAIPLLEQTLADCERVLGADHPTTIDSRNNLGGVYASAGDLGRAIPLLEQTLADSERVQGADHPDTLGSRNNLAGAYASAGDLGRSISLHERTLLDCERVLGADHPNTLDSRSNLAFAYQLAGDFSLAIPMLEQTLADRERVLGAANVKTLLSRSNLANAYWHEGRREDALQGLEDAAASAEQSFGSAHSVTRQLIGIRNEVRRAIAQEDA